MTWAPPRVRVDHFEWLRSRWSQDTLLAAARMTYIENGENDADADAQLRKQGAYSLGRMLATIGVPENAVVYEIGCGAGRVATELVAHLKRGRYVGVDLSPQYVEICKRRCRGEFMTTPGIGFPLSDASADLVVEWTVFCHMPTEAVWLWMLDVVRVLKPGGHTYMQFHNAASDHQWAEFAKHARTDRFLTDPGYPRGMEWATVQRLHENAGLEMVKVNGVDEDVGGFRSWFVVARKKS